MYLNIYKFYILYMHRKLGIGKRTLVVYLHRNQVKIYKMLELEHSNAPAIKITAGCTAASSPNCSVAAMEREVRGRGAEQSCPLSQEKILTFNNLQKTSLPK